jgi:hypothetical protein
MLNSELRVILRVVVAWVNDNFPTNYGLASNDEAVSLSRFGTLKF